MNSKSLRWITGSLLIITPILFMTAFTMLQMNFEYPNILRQPTAYILEKFSAGGTSLVATWYVFMLTALLFIPAAVLLHPFLARADAKYVFLATMLGVLAGVVQVFGLMRWAFVMPYLAQTYVDAASSQTTRDTIEVVFQTLHRYAGMGIGETLGYMFTGGWVLLISIAMFKSRYFKKWLGWIGVVLALAIFVGIFEWMGLPLAGAINALGYTLWAVWLIVVGIFVLRVREPAA
jgi:hypothetical protein